VKTLLGLDSDIVKGTEITSFRTNAIN